VEAAVGGAVAAAQVPRPRALAVQAASGLAGFVALWVGAGAAVLAQAAAPVPGPEAARGAPGGRQLSAGAVAAAGRAAQQRVRPVQALR
jgi:hypothetical protein